LLWAVLGLAGLGLAAWLAHRHLGAGWPGPPPGADVPPDPRLAYAGPFENVHPSVGFVGDARCAECHVDIVQSYARHPMGRSTAPIRELAGKQPYDAAHHNPFDAHGVRLWVQREGDRVWHRHAQVEDGQPLWEVRQEVHYAVGSGTRGYSYLTEIDGYLYQTPITWYSQKGIWDISPGFEDLPIPGRPIVPGCLQCHANRFELAPGYQRRYRPGVFDGYSIGCERCHGPGQKHADSREAGRWPEGEVDTTIVNPARLPWPLRENVCEQCHLGGEARVPRRGRGWLDYRPGLPLEDFLAIFVKNPALPGAHKAVGHVEQMRKSKCFTRSAGKNKLGCVSCHDPHQKVEPAQAAAHYRARCLACHQEKGCRLVLAERWRKSPGDNCAACHMPRAATADIAHTALTDHGIIRPGRADVPAGAGIAPGEPPIVLFHRDRVEEGDPERRRDLGVALVTLLNRNEVPPLYRDAMAYQAASLLGPALGRGPTDPTGWLAYGEALLLQGRGDDARAALERGLEKAPNSEEVLQRLGNLELEGGRVAEGIRYWKRVVGVNPYDPKYRHGLGGLLAETGDWAGAAEQARAWVRLEPGSSTGRQLLVLSLLELGRPEDARRQFAHIRRLRPPNLRELEVWFARRQQALGIGH
jgi:predicted CXXCH cytochrome family protein